MIAAYDDAELLVLQGKDAVMNGRRHTMEDLESIRRGRQEWENRRSIKINRAAASASGPALAVFN